MNKLIDNDLVKNLLQGYFPKYQFFKNLLVVFSIFFAILALVNPQFSNKKEKIKASSSDIFIALDISQSMMAEDISPNRLEKTKKVIEDIINSNKGNRISLIFFAGEAFLKMPLTLDYSAALLFAKSASPDQIENQGTAIGEAIKIAENSDKSQSKSQKSLIIFSDGEDHEGNSAEEAKKAHEQGFNIITVAVGTKEGGFIPYKNEYGVETYKKDNDGKFIRSIVNSNLLMQIADNGGGYFYNILDDDLINNINSKISKLEKKEIVQNSFKDYQSYFWVFMIFSVLFLLLYFLVPQRRFNK
ncbi:MAG: VWA domain-containing protein [Saprospiraceae bacterium]